MKSFKIFAKKSPHTDIMPLRVFLVLV